MAEYWASSFLQFYTQRQNMFLIEQALPSTDNYTYINIAEKKVFLVVTILALVFGRLNQNTRVASDHHGC